MSDDKYRLDDFELYQLSRKFRQNVYRLIKQLPSEERYCLDPQMRRAIVSVTNNIAEGHGRWHYQENMRFCRIARGSIEEILDDINVCIDEGYTEKSVNEQFKQEGYELIAKVNSYIGYLRRCKQGMESRVPGSLSA
ncbi:four helix bundle protein [bacterium]|nr:four helix bundle protein [bacterium]